MERSRPAVEVLMPHGRFSHKTQVTALTAVSQSDGPPILFSGAVDGSIKSWKFNPAGGPPGSGRPHQWLNRALGEGHVRAVSGMQFVNNRLVTCGLDHCIQVWDPTKPLGPTAVLAGARAHSSEVTALCPLTIKGDPCLVTGATNGSLVVWNAKNPDKLVEMKREREYTKKPISCLKCMQLPASSGAGAKNICVVGHRDGGMTVRNVDKGMPIYSVLGHHSSAGSGHSRVVLGVTAVHGGVIRGWLTVSQDNTIMAWMDKS